MWFICIFLVFIVALAFYGNVKLERKRTARLGAMTQVERTNFLSNERAAAEIKRRIEQDRQDGETYGLLNAAMICPHCNSSGRIRTMPVVNKKGVSGGKATAALLTGGVSLLAVGLSRKEKGTQARCGNCTNTWVF